jgi:three-Cys-motif partner protein
MKYSHLFQTLSIDTRKLDDKKEQTGNKIKYITAYVNNWLYVVTNRPTIKNINFVDCMCNAGIYMDGDLTTALEALLLFAIFAKDHRDKKFHVFLNDISLERVNICKSICENMQETMNIPDNVIIHYDNQDVNSYIEDYSVFDKYLMRDEATIFFVDPYDLGTVIIEKVAKLSKRYYCEIIFNVFTSDLVRNGKDERISKCVGNEEIAGKGALLDYVSDQLKVGYIKYCFAYEFRNSKNTELYRIFFATPHKRGLEKLKEAIWETFDGKEYFRNQDPSMQQITLFTECGEDVIQLDFHASKAKRLLVNEFAGKTVHYPVIELFLLEKSMLKSSDLITNVIKPLIQNGIIRKIGTVNGNNFKEDKYQFAEDNR